MAQSLEIDESQEKVWAKHLRKIEVNGLGINTNCDIMLWFDPCSQSHLVKRGMVVDVLKLKMSTLFEFSVISYLILCKAIKSKSSIMLQRPIF